MRRLTSTKLFGILVFSLLMIFAVSTDANAQGRGRRAGHSDKKCSKFVNCHDARDGRWDGRGPRRSGFDVTNIFRRSRRNRDSDRGERRRRHNRDWDHNRTGRGRR